MRDVLTRLESWLRRHAPDVEAALAPGLMQQALDLYERDDLRTKLSPGLRALYHWRNGVLPDRTAPLVGRHEPIKLGAGVRAMRDEVLPVFGVPGEPDEYIGWHVPTGRVIAAARGERRVIAPDFDAYLIAYVESLDAGVVDGDTFAAALATRFPPQVFVPAPKAVVAQAPPAPAPIAYSPSKTFAVDDRIAHPKLGTGVVRAVQATKVDVEFSSGTKVLVHARRS